MKFMCVIGIGILLGLIGRIAIPLSYFILKIEDGKECDNCKKRESCFARKRMIHTNSNYIDEFIVFSFYKIRNFCKFSKKSITNQDITYIAVNVLLTVVLFWSKGISMVTILYCVSAAMLLSLSIVDWNTEYIPLEYNIVIFGCGLIRLLADFSNWAEYVIGLITVSGFLYIVNKIATPLLRKKYQEEQEVDSVMGDGDIKLMAATGLLLGWKLNFLALGIGCIAGSVIHLILMKIKGSGRQFALGPYLSLGVYITMICGEQLVGWYLNMMGVKPL